MGWARLSARRKEHEQRWKDAWSVFPFLLELGIHRRDQDKVSKITATQANIA